MCSYLNSMRLGHLYVLACELSYELTEPHGALSLLIICKCWNRGHCIAPSLLCCFAHKCSSCFGPHHVGACPVEPPSQSCPSCKRPVDASPPRSSGSCGSTPNSRRLNLCWMAFVMGLNWVLVLLKSSSLPRGTSLVVLGMPLSLYLANEISQGEGGGFASVNDGINPDEFTLHYLTVDQIIWLVSHLGKWALMAKFDVESAYHNVPVHPSDRFLLRMKWCNQYYVDLALPMR